MGLDISKITNAELQKLAYLKDGDNNGTLDAEEFAIFKAEVAAKEGVSTEDFNQVMGLYTTNPVEATEATAPQEEPKAPTDGMTEKQAKKYKSEANEAHIKYLEGFVKDGGTRADVLKMLDSKANLDPQFRKAVADIIALMPATYASSDEIKHKDLEKKLENAGLKDDLHKDILKQLEKMAKNECIAEQTSQIADAYAAKLAANPKLTSQQIMDEIKKEAKAAGKFKGDFKDAYKAFNQPMIDAYRKVYDAISQIDDLEKGGKVQDKAEDILKANGQWDKYTKKALLGDRNIFKRFKSFMTGYKSDGRIASDNKGRQNKVEHKKTQTTQEIMDSLGNKTELFVALREAGFITETEDGKWDLSELSELIGTQVGDDYKVNRHHKKDKLISEKLKTQSALRVISGLSELDEKHAMALVKLCGYDIEGKHLGRAIFGGLAGMASGAAVGMASTYAAAQMLPKEIQVPYYKDKEYDISKELLDGMQGKLPEGISIDASGNIHIITDILIQIPRLAGQLGQLGLYSAIPGALVGTALGVLSGLKDKGETPVLSNNFTETTYEAYVERLNRENPQYAQIGMLIAASFVDEKGNWDREGYKDFLNTMGGDGGLINREELIGGLQKRQKALENKDNDDNGDDDCVEEKCNVAVEEKPGEEKTETQDRTFVHLRKENPGVGWKEMVEAYFPGLVEACGGKLYGADGAIRAFQKELCTDENGNFDAAKLQALITATDVPKEIKIPLQVKGIDRVETKPTPAGRVATSGTGAYRPAMDKVGRDEQVTTKQVGPSTHLATDGCNGHTASGSTPREAVENLERQEKKQYSNRDEYIQ